MCGTDPVVATTHRTQPRPHALQASQMCATTCRAFASTLTYRKAPLRSRRCHCQWRSSTEQTSSGLLLLAMGLSWAMYDDSESIMLVRESVAHNRYRVAEKRSTRVYSNFKFTLTAPSR